MLCFSYTLFLDLTFQMPLNSSMNESLLLLFDDLWKVKTKHIVLCLIALTKFWNAKGASYHPALMGNIQLLVTCVSHINPVNELLFVSSACYAGQEMLWSRSRCLLGRKCLIYTGKRTQKCNNYDKERR